MSYLGDFKVGSTVHFKFSTNSAAGARTDQSSAWETTDIRVYKDSSTTERSSQSGYVLVGPFDSMTGITQGSIDTSDNTDAGFFAAGHDYQVVLYPDETVDSQLVAFVVCEFSIENRYTNLCSTGLDTVVMADIAAVPSMTATAKAALNWLFCAARNKRIQTATTETIYKDDGTTAVATSTKSDDGTTFTRGEYS